MQLQRFGNKGRGQVSSGGKNWGPVSMCFVLTQAPACHAPGLAGKQAEMPC